MKLNHLFSLLRLIKIPGLLPIMADCKGVIRFHFLYSAIDSGLLEAMRTPCSRNDLIAKMDVKQTEILDALLKVGVSIKELKLKNNLYSIKGKRSKAMIGPKGDMLSALVQANVTYYNNSYRKAASRIKGAPLSDDLKWAGDIVARLSKLTNPIIKNFISEIIRDKPSPKVIDIGCGSGMFLKIILDLNSKATGIGIEKDEEVAIKAIQNIKDWGLEDRLKIIKGDIRDLPIDQSSVDLITLINVVYYFQNEKRVEFFRSLRSRLSPKGSLVIVMNMQGKDYASANLNMANASLKGVTPLPNPLLLKDQLIESGFTNVRTTNLMPGSSFIGMHAQ